jgi:hypothetical protein
VEYAWSSTVLKILHIPLAIQTGQGSKFFYKYMGPTGLSLAYIYIYIYKRIQHTPSFRVCDSQINSETYVVTSEKLDQRRMKNLCWQDQ